RIEYPAQRIRAQHVGLEAEDVLGRDNGAAGGVGQLLGLGWVDVGDRQFRAFSRGVERDPGSNAARTLERDMQPGDIVLAELVADRRLQAEKNAERRMRTGIAAYFAAFGREPGDVFRLAADLDHVRDAHADVFGGDIAAAEAIHGPAERGEEFGRLGPRFVGQDDRLPA